MIFYHGSKQIVEAPRQHGSNPTNDYGPSFYMTLELEAAKSWACRNDSLGIVNQYRMSDSEFQKMKVLDLTDKSHYSVLHWIAILMHFRTLDSSFKRNNRLVLEWLEKYYIDVDEYDVVIGFRADDTYFRFPIRFISNDLAFEDLENVFLSGNLGIQYAFMSSKAVEALRFEKAIECEDSFLGHYYHSITKASRDFDEILNQPRDPGKTYILDLMRQDHE
ncbi:MAG: DUF3990 domain-containing protein [Bacilli bacterium]|nr:DUF3990 domain-containing protein [Bacilli bacterium]